MNNLPAVRNSGNEKSNELTQLVSFHLDNEEYGVEVLEANFLNRIILVTYILKLQKTEQSKAQQPVIIA